MNFNPNTQANDLPSLSIRRPVLIVVLNLLVIIAGLAAINAIEVRELPDVDRPVITVRAVLPGASPETIDTEITSKLEGAVARVSGVKSIRAQSEENSARIVVEFRPGIDLDNAANETRESVSRVQRELPDDVEQVAIIKADNNAESVVSLAISSSQLDLESMTERIDKDLAPLFLSIPGVADVRLVGDRERVLRVMLDPLRLTSYGLTVSQVAAVLRQAPFDVPAGSFRSTDHQLIVRADATSVSAQQVKDIIIAADTRIGDVADVYFGPADGQNMVRLNGVPVIGTREVFFAVIATTAVFVPIAFLPSTAGRLFREFGGVLAGAVIISSFVALSLVPALTAKLATKNTPTSNVLTRLGDKLLSIYRVALHWSLQHAWLVFLLSTLAAIGAGTLYWQLENQLLPSEDRGVIRVFARGSDGVGLNFMDRQAIQMKDILQPLVEQGEIDSIYTVVGQGDPNIVSITARLNDWSERSLPQQDIISQIRGPLGAIPGAPGRAFGTNSLSLRGQGGGLEIALTGQNYADIFSAALQFSQALEREYPEFGKPDISYQPTQPQLRVEIDRQRADELDVPPQ